MRNDVVIHMYTATAPTWRNTVLGKDRDELRSLILHGALDVLTLTEDMPNIRFQFSPEVFNLTEPDYVLEICDAVAQLWDATESRPVILNLPATVEVATPNVYADQIEYMHRNLARRDAVILSVHPHNDRGTGGPAPNWPCWQARNASRAVCSAMVSAPATSTSPRWP